ncbi:MAG: PIN domain nuclease [Verrucomicrobia bacterium]|nr:PIN domain nuclease [Verrucomicrobiota bacterium]
MILIDTDICVEILKGNAGVIEMRAKTTDVVAISFMTAGELFYGVMKSDRPARHARVVEEFLRSVIWLNSDAQIMVKFGELKARLALGGELLPDADILVAATALSKCAYLVTGNTGHFSRFSGLRLENWAR